MGFYGKMAGDLVQYEIAFNSVLWCNLSPVEILQSSQYPPPFSGRIQLNLICSILAQANLWITSDSTYPHLHLYFLPPMQAATVMKKRGKKTTSLKKPTIPGWAKLLECRGRISSSVFHAAAARERAAIPCRLTG